MRDYVELGESEIIDETENSVLVEIDERREWIPRSVFHPDTDVGQFTVGDTVDVVIESAWAEREGYV